MEPDLLPCPFCGGEPEQIDMNDLSEHDPNVGGSCICCKRCGASSPVHFDRKENLCASWNDRVFAAGYVPASEVQRAREEALRLRLSLSAVRAALGCPDEIDGCDRHIYHEYAVEAIRAEIDTALGGQHDD